MFETIAARVDFPNKATLESVIELAVEIAREGREGHRVGTLIMLGDAERVLAMSRLMILDPVACHPAEVRSIDEPHLRGTLKELAQLDGAFVINDDGIVVSACRYLDASTGDIEMPLGFGSRHLAGAAMSRATKAVAIVVSESAVVRVFEGGVLIADIIPELWLLKQHTVHLETR